MILSPSFVLVRKVRDVWEWLNCMHVDTSEGGAVMSRCGFWNVRYLIRCKNALGPRMGFTLFIDSEVRHVRCDYIMHYSTVCKYSMRASWCARNTEKQGEGEIYVKLV